MVLTMTACPKIKAQVNTEFCKGLCKMHHEKVGCILKELPEYPKVHDFEILVVNGGNE